MFNEGFLWLLSIFNCCLLIILAVYFLITLSDLECDYLNANTCCKKLNKWILAEVIMTCLQPIFMVLNHNWFKFILNIPLSLYISNKYLSKSPGQIGLYDPTEIHNRSLLKSYMKTTMYKIGYHTVFFFIYMYSAIFYMVA